MDLCFLIFSALGFICVITYIIGLIRLKNKRYQLAARGSWDESDLYKLVDFSIINSSILILGIGLIIVAMLCG